MPDFVQLDHSDLGLEADRLGDHPHPREMLWYGGSIASEHMLLNAYRSEKLHHAWLISGPEGIGKATLAYRFARFLFANPDPTSAQVQQAADLSVPADHPVTGKVARLSHPDLAVIRRGLTKDGKSLRAEIAVDDVRDGLSLFKVTAGAGGWRIVIVDAADDLNRASANALLKMLEEPPSRAIFLLLAQKPGSLLPTIRSRCQTLRVAALEQAVIIDGIKRLTGNTGPQMAEVAQLAQGSLREALILLDPTTAAFRRETRRLLEGNHQLEGKALMALLEKTTGKTGVDAFHILIEMIEQHLREMVLGDKSSAILAATAELWEKLRTSARDVETYNLDRRPFLLSIFAQLADIKSRT